MVAIASMVLGSLFLLAAIGDFVINNEDAALLSGAILIGAGVIAYPGK